MAVLSPEGRKETQKVIDYYMQNAKIIRDGLSDLGMVTAFGGTNAAIHLGQDAERPGFLGILSTS